MNKSELKILIATGIYPPSIGGPATYAKLLVDKLPARGVGVDVLSFDEVRKYPKGISHFIYLIKLLKKTKGVDIIYAQDPVSVGLPAMIVSKISRKIFVLKVVGDYAWEQGVSRYGIKDQLDEFVIKKYKNIFVRFLKWIETLVAGNAEKVIVPSNYLKNVVKEWGVNKKRIKVVYNAFKKPELSTLHKKETKTIKIISVGRLVPWKGFDVLMDLVAEISKEKDIKLSIVGDGPQYNNLKNKIKEKGLEKINLSGRMSQDDLYNEIKKHDIFVLNTSYEGFSHLILEVMALGVPVITTAVGGNIEIIINEKNGLLVPFGDRQKLLDAIKDLIDNKDKRVTLAENAIKDVSVFTEENMLNNLVKELKEIV